MSLRAIDLLDSLGQANTNTVRALGILEEGNGSPAVRSSAAAFLQSAIHAYGLVAETAWPEPRKPTEYYTLVQSLESVNRDQAVTSDVAKKLREDAALVLGGATRALLQYARIEDRRLPGLSEFWFRMERKRQIDVALLQFDVRGSVQLQQELSPECWAGLIGRFLDDADRIVRGEEAQDEPSPVSLKRGSAPAFGGDAAPLNRETLDPGSLLAHTGDGRIYVWPASQFGRAFSCALQIVALARARNFPPIIVGRDGAVTFAVRTVITVGSINFNGQWATLKTDGPALTLGARLQGRREERGDNGVIVGADPRYAALVQAEAGRYLSEQPVYDNVREGLCCPTWLCRPEQRAFRRVPAAEVPVTVSAGMVAESGLLRDHEPRAARVELDQPNGALRRGSIVQIALGPRAIAGRILDYREDAAGRHQLIVQLAETVA